MSSSRVTEVLYDSETVLRLVDRELEELCDAPLDGHPLAVLLAVMQRANMEITQVLTTLHDSREALRGVTLQEIHDSTNKLAEVSSATELAATRIMDGLERTHGLMDRLDELDGPDGGGDAAVEAAALRARLRDELFAMMGSLQFQDITSQQLGHVSQMLGDVERRLRATAALLGGCYAEESSAMDAEPTFAFSESARAFAESASTRDVRERQAMADALFGRRVAFRVAH
jgi:chemotaxis regulatin CheY-phosphate phosphatase CheZ